MNGNTLPSNSNINFRIHVCTATYYPHLNTKLQPNAFQSRPVLISAKKYDDVQLIQNAIAAPLALPAQPLEVSHARAMTGGLQELGP